MRKFEADVIVNIVGLSETVNLANLCNLAVALERVFVFDINCPQN